MIQFALNMMALSSALYVCGAMICRVRHPSSQMSRAWRSLHVIVVGLAGWLGADALVVGVTPWAATVGVCLGGYVWLTRKAWINGVPSIARPQP